MKTNRMMMVMLAALMLGAAAFAQAPNTTAAPARPAFTDADGDGVCDNTPARGAWGQGRGRGMTGGQGQGRGVCPNFADADKDGVCDTFVDADGDGVCDSAPANCPQGRGQGRGRGMTGGRGQGRGACPNFVDADQDGKCDLFTDADGNGVCDSAPANCPQGRGVRNVSAGGGSRTRWSTGGMGAGQGARRGRAR